MQIGFANRKEISMKIFFCILGVLVILMLIFGRRVWDGMNDDMKYEVNNLYSGGLKDKEEIEKEKKHEK